MLGRMRVALKFMTVGLLLGVILAPRSGAETRHQLTDRVSSMARGMVGGSGSTSV